MSVLVCEAIGFRTVHMTSEALEQYTPVITELWNMFLKGHIQLVKKEWNPFYHLP